MRYLLSIIVSIIISTALFFGMQIMTSSNSNIFENPQKSKHLLFLREKKESNIERKKRIKPNKPKKQKVPKKLKIVKIQQTKIDQNVKVKPFKVENKQIELSSISSLSGAQFSISKDYLDAYNLRALRRVNPKYPRRAKIRKVEGMVQLSFTISKDGLVSNVKVLDSNPKNTFEKSSISAIKRWRFKPHKEIREASIRFNFRLVK